MKKETYKKYGWILIWGFVSIIFAVILHCLFSIEAPISFLQAKWNAGDILTYSSTILLGLLALWQNQRFKNENDATQKKLEALSTRANELQITSKLIEHESARINLLRTQFQAFFDACACNYLVADYKDTAKGEKTYAYYSTLRSSQIRTSYQVLWQQLNMDKGYNSLVDDVIIFISIDENEVENIKKICNEIFGESNFLTCVTRATGTPTGGGFDGLVNELDYMLIYAKNASNATINGLEMSAEDSKIYDQVDEQGRYLIRPLRRTGGEDRREDRPTMFFPIIAPDGTEVYPIGPTGYESRWICSPDTAKRLADSNMLAWKQVTKNGETRWQVYQKFYLENRTKAPGNLWTDVEGNKKATRDVRDVFDSKKVFDFPKPIGFLKKAISIGANSDSIILDFFSGSATTAHAVMQLNAEDGGHRKFIMVQLPEKCDEKSEAYKAGYKTICEIGKERIRRAGKKIREENTDNSSLLTPNSKLDTGFRVLKCDTSNMKDVYYNPAEYEVNMFSRLEDNIKEDRTPEDLLFQVMLDLGVLLSSKIEETTIAGKKVFNVEDNYLIACFDSDVSEETIKAIAKQKPYYFVMRDSSMASDSVATNFDQIFATYSPDTVRKVL